MQHMHDKGIISKSGLFGDLMHVLRARRSFLLQAVGVASFEWRGICIASRRGRGLKVQAEEREREREKTTSAHVEQIVLFSRYPPFPIMDNVLIP